MKKRKTCPRCFHSISEGTRMRIIKQLKNGPDNVNNIAAHFDLTQPTISYHLKFLEKTGMVSSKKSGRENFYYLNEKYPCKKCNLFKLPFKT
ncbi:ArsR/SmtB family transcription factor [Patescibacteria group bacterium]